MTVYVILNNLQLTETKIRLLIAGGTSFLAMQR